jgi:tol-pal system protein YbgF
MLISGLSLSRSPPGLGHRLRRVGGKALVLTAAASALTGCATKRDLRDLRDEIRALSAQQQQALEGLEGLNLQVRDTLRGQSDAIFETRGQTLQRLRDIEDQLARLMELTGQNQRSLAALRDLVEGRGAVGYAPSRGDPDPDTGGTGDSTDAAQATYEAAVRVFNRGSFSTARRAFQQFLEEHPSHPLVPDAKFYLADILVGENELEEAMAAFLEIPEFHPSAEKVPDALYRVGVLNIELDQLDEARRYLNQVVENYPDSGAAILARQRLAEIS